MESEPGVYIILNLEVDQEFSSCQNQYTQNPVFHDSYSSTTQAKKSKSSFPSLSSKPKKVRQASLLPSFSQTLICYYALRTSMWHTQQVVFPKITQPRVPLSWHTRNRFQNRALKFGSCQGRCVDTPCCSRLQHMRRPGEKSGSSKQPHCILAFPINTQFLIDINYKSVSIQETSLYSHHFATIKEE